MLQFLIRNTKPTAFKHNNKKLLYVTYLKLKQYVGQTDRLEI
jgi:hypothetical protein